VTTESPPTRVYRTRRRVIAGVAGGFGRYFAIDPNVVRIVLVLLAFAGGIGILLYLAAWLIVPEEPVGNVDPSAAGHPPARTNLLAIVLVGLLALVVVATIGRRTFDVAPATVWALALIGGGAAVLWLRSPDARTATGAPGETTAPTPPGATPPAPAYPPPPAPAVAGTPSEPWTVAPVAPSPLQRIAPVLGRIAVVLVATVAAAVIAAIGVLLVEGPGSVDVTPLEAVVVGIVVVAAAVVFGMGRRRLPDAAPVALALVAVVAFAGWIGPPFQGGWGVRRVTPDVLVSRESVYRLAGGRLTIDLRDTRLGERARILSTSVATGSVDVIVPRDVNVELQAHVDAGGIKSFGVDEGGLGVERHAVDRVTGATRTLLVRARVGCGEIVVRRDSGRTQPVAVPPIPKVPSPPPVPAPALAPAVWSTPASKEAVA